MITVNLYSRQGCHLCDQARQDLESLQSAVPHKLVEIDVDSQPRLQRLYGEHVPVVEAGPYILKAPFDRQELNITLGAVQLGQQHDRAIDQSLADVQSPTWNFADRFAYWLSKHYLAVLNLIIFIYAGLPVLAPVLMNAGATGPASGIYRVYGAMCHQMAFRSQFLFGEQPFYPRQAAGVAGLLTYEQATGLDGEDIVAARSFIGNDQIGYKLALCERDIAIYGGMLLFGLLFAVARWTPYGQLIRPLHWVLWILIGLVPIGLDGASQLVSQLPFGLLPYRESTPFLRTLTGGLFGFTTAWFGFPLVEETMRDTRGFMEAKLRRLKGQV